ncbi:MAG: hypothetical protein VB997_04165 [Opitutales bacterium]
MKNVYAFIGILLAAIATSYLIAEDREEGERELKQVDFEKVAKDLKKAVEEGKISGEDARRRLSALRERVGREQNRKPTDARVEREHDGDREALMQWGQEQRRKIQELKEAGHHEEAEKLIQETRKIMAEKTRHLAGGRERGERNEPRERQHTERRERDHDEDPLKRWAQERERAIDKLADEGRHEKARALADETRKIIAERQQHRRNEERERHHREHGERDHEEDELKRWANEREREIHELAKAGRHEEAKRLGEETRRIIEEKMRHRRNEERERHERTRHDHDHGERDHEGDELERWVHEQHLRIRKLQESNRHEEAERLERELEEKITHFRRQQERDHGERERHEGNRHMEERVKHLMVAIEHLHAAGMHDVAEEVERRAHGDHNRRDHRGDDREDDRGHGNNEVDQLRGEVDELRRALHEMREFIDRQHERRDRPRPE